MPVLTNWVIKTCFLFIFPHAGSGKIKEREREKMKKKEKKKKKTRLDKGRDRDRTDNGGSTGMEILAWAGGSFRTEHSKGLTTFGQPSCSRYMFWICIRKWASVSVNASEKQVHTFTCRDMSTFVLQDKSSSPGTSYVIKLDSPQYSHQGCRQGLNPSEI